MLTPLDKYQTRANDIIQLVVTTSCNLFTCSNCTQLLPFRTDYLHMQLDCFEKAVQSVRGWPGIVALFGGNPCSHPKFPELCEILSHYIPQERRGLWTNDLLQHGSIAHDTFYPDGRFNLNAHAVKAAADVMEHWLPGKLIPSTRTEPAWHSAVLVSHRDLNIPYDLWVEKRERCDINQKWSGAVVERDGEPYAYFCEVAASLDGIKGKNHGIPATPGWWGKSMSEFSTQVRNCCDAGCGVPLRLKGHLDWDDHYDISRTFIPMTTLKANRRVTITIHDSEPEHCTLATDYTRTLQGEK